MGESNYSYSNIRLYADSFPFEFPELVKVQKESYASFITEDNLSTLNDMFSSVFPLEDSYNRATLDFVSCKLGRSKYSAYECIERGLTYSIPFTATLRLTVWDDDSFEKKKENADKKIKSVREQEIYMGEIPMMSDNGTFIINGVERVVVSQMHRAPGVFFDHDKGKAISQRVNYFARIIPYRGSWLDFEFGTKDSLYFRIDKKRKISIFLLLRALKLSNHEILNYFYDKIKCTRHLDANGKYDGKWVFEFSPENFKGVTLAYDLIDAETNQLILKESTRVSIALAKRFYKNGLRKYLVPAKCLEGYHLADNILDASNGDVLIKYGSIITSEDLNKIDILNVDSLNFVNLNSNYIMNAILQNDCSYEDAMIMIYKIVRPGEIPSVEAGERLFESLFFSEDRYDLLKVGRVRINARLNLNYDENLTTLTKEDILCTVKELINLQVNLGEVDDIDHLGNRRIRSVGEFVDNQFRIGLVRMSRVIVENMATADFETVMPCDLVNSKILIAVVKEFFMSSPLSQFMDQTNPLSEITHKRRISALGPGGLNRGRAGFEVRDVHPTHYGRMCAIETPEGGTIGLINSMAICARVNKYGFIETPYRKVQDGRITDEIHYLSAIEEAKYYICQANVKIDDGKNILEDTLCCRKNYENVFVPKSEVQYADVSAKQIVSVAASLIPFLENDDANRALMGSNMQRQAVPLLNPTKPLIGTGMESHVAIGSGVLIKAKRAGIVDYVDATNIVVRSNSKDEFWVDSYNLRKFQKSNHNTCIHQRPIVSVGQFVNKDDILTDGPAIDKCELALGRNLVVAFLSWRGYNFEDSILISSNVVRDDAFTSVHIEEFECIVRDTRLGPEEVTRDIPGVGEEFLHHLDEFGVVHIGANVEAGDVLVGKVTPKSTTPVTAEEKLLRAIFGEKAIDVKDSSLYLPPGVSGSVVDVKIFLRRGIEKYGRALLIERKQINLENARKEHETKIFNNYIYSTLSEKLIGKIAKNSVSKLKKGEIITKDLLDSVSKEVWWDIIVDNIDEIRSLREEFDNRIIQINKSYEENIDKITSHDDLMQGVLSVIKVSVAVKHTLQPGDKMSGRHGNKGVISRIIPAEDMPYLSDGTPVDIILNPLGVPSRMNVGQILETHLGWAAYNLGKKIKNLLNSNANANNSNTDSNSDSDYNSDYNSSFNSSSNSNNITELRSLILEIYKNDKKNLAVLEKMQDDEFLKYAETLKDGVPIAAPVFEGPKTDEIERLLILAGVDPSGQETLYDGMTGEPLDRKVTVGCKYMLKLHHLVNDKIHARSIGPYSLITQQPLGGKSHFGGQRFGEMECWALEAYGAAFSLQEVLTVKSDDVIGRINVYDSIVKGDNNFYSGVPESFNVLLKELQGLALNIELTNKGSGESTEKDIEIPETIDDLDSDVNVGEETL